MSRSSKLSAADYAQNRRDNEKAATEALRALVPNEFFQADIEGNGNYNLPTKAMKAAIAYLQSQAEEESGEEEEMTESKATGKGKGKGKPGTLSTTSDDEEEEEEEDAPPPSLPPSNIPENNQLRQFVRRLLAKSEEKVAAAGKGGLSEELKKSMEMGSDLCVDLIKVIEQEGWSEEMKRKWEGEFWAVEIGGER